MYQPLKYRPPKATCFRRHLYSSLMCFFSAPRCEITSVQWVGKYHSTMLGDHVGALSLHFRLLWANCFTQKVSTSLHLSLITAAVSLIPHQTEDFEHSQPLQAILSALHGSEWRNRLSLLHTVQTILEQLGFVTLDKTLIQNPDHYL